MIVGKGREERGGLTTCAWLGTIAAAVGRISPKAASELDMPLLSFLIRSAP